MPQVGLAVHADTVGSYVLITVLCVDVDLSSSYVICICTFYTLGRTNLLESSLECTFSSTTIVRAFDTEFFFSSSF